MKLKIALLYPSKTMTIFYKLVLVFLILSSCAKSSIDSTDINAKKDYYKAMRAFDQRNYDSALKSFTDVSNKYALDKISRNSLMMEIFLNYLIKNYTAAYEIGEMYSKLYPAELGIEYVKYIQVLSKIKMIQDPDISASSAFEALELTKSFMSKYPHSKYISKIQNNKKLIDEYISVYTVQVGDQYALKNNCIAAVKNYKEALFYAQETSKYLTKQDVLKRIEKCTNEIIFDL